MNHIYEMFAGYYCCKNDPFFTLDFSQTDLSSIVGYSADEIATLFDGKLINLVHPEDREIVLKLLKRHYSEEDIYEISHRMYHKSGDFVWVLTKSKLLHAEDGSEYYAGILTDVTNSTVHHLETEKALERYKIILSQTENIVFEYDLVTDELELSETWETIFGFKPSTHDFLKTLVDVTHMHPEDVPSLLKHLDILHTGAGYQTMEARIQRITGEYIWTRIRATALYNEEGIITKIVGIIINIDSEKKASDELQERAEQDPLTKLLNSETARKQSEEYLSSNVSNRSCSLLIIDLDNFKQVNDYYGHMYGDHFLIRTADEIRKLFRSGDIVGRIGGDEFMVLMKDVASPSLVEKRCMQLIESLHSISGEPSEKCTSGCSIGVAFSPEHGTTYNELFQHADEALYRAKAQGKSCYLVYNE